MATSGYTDAWVTSWDTLRFSWWQIEQSILYNYTKIGWNIQLISGSSGAIYSTAGKSWNVTVNGSYCDGTNYVNIGNNSSKVLASGETVIYHDADGSKKFVYSFNQYFGITFSGSKINTVGDSGSAWLEPIPRQATITSAPDFNDTDSPTIRFNNPAGSAVKVQFCISWTGGDDIAYRELDNYNHNYYTFNFTPDELNKLYNATLNGSNSRYVTFYVTTVIGTQWYYSVAQRLFTVTDCEPTLNPTVVDTGGVSTALTGDGTPNSDTLIRYYNYITATFNATPKKGASIVSRSVRCGSRNKYPSGDYAIFEGAEDKTFVFTIRDNRGNTVEKTASFNTLIPYTKLTCNTIVDKDLNDDNTANINLNISGDYFDGSFGTASNTLTVEYRYKDNTTDFPEEWSVAECTITDGEYAASVILSGLDYKNTYTIQTRAKDAVYTGYVNAKDEIVKIVPVFDWSENDFNFNVPVTIQGKPARAFESVDRIARAYTQQEIEYSADSYIKLFRDGSPTDLYNQNIATFNDNGLITINKDMIALVNVHILSYNNNTNKRSWISLWNYDTNWRYTDSIVYGDWSTSDISIVINFTAGATFGVRTFENMVINYAGPVGSYIEIIEL